MTTITNDWGDAIDSILNFEADIDDDFDAGLAGFFNLDREIKDNIFGFVRVGIVADRIRRFKLWERAKFDSFADYCKRSLNKSFWYVNRIIDAARVVRILIDNGFTVLPTCEAQCRPLAQFLNDRSSDSLIDWLTGDDAGVICDYWQDAIASCPPDKITAAHVAKIVNGEPEVKASTNIKVPTQLSEQISAEAARRGLSVPEYLTRLVNGEALEIEPPDDYIAPGTRVEFTDEEVGILDALDREFKTPAPKPQPLGKKIEELSDRIFGAIGDIRWGRNHVFTVDAPS